MHAVHCDADIALTQPDQNGKNTVAPDRVLDFNAPRSPQSVVAGDFNRDGIMDAAVRCQGEKLCIFPGTGRSYFGPLTLYPVSFNGVLATGDLNGDDFQGLPGGKFASPREFGTAQPYDAWTPVDACQFAFLDINGDGYLDIAIADQVMGITRLLNAGRSAAK